MAPRVTGGDSVTTAMVDGRLGGHSMSYCVELQDLTISYDRHPAVHHVSGGFAPHSLTVIAGPNGAGKSTLLKAIAGVVTPESGHVLFQGLKRSEIAYLPQVSESQRYFPMTVLQMVTTGHWHRSGSLKPISHEMRERAREAIQTVGLGGFTDRPISTLSAGQFQRAMFARLLVQDAKLILLDEPFNAIDDDTTRRLIEIMQAWHAEKRTIICVLHDLAQIRSFFPDCLLIARECIAWGKTGDVMTAANRLRARFFNGAWQHDAELCEQSA